MTEAVNSQNSPNSAWTVALSLVALLWLWWVLTQILVVPEGASGLDRAISGGAVSQGAFLKSPWRLVTASLLHTDMRHLGINSILTGVFAATLSIQTRPRFVLLVFFLSGWIGSLLAIFVQPGWNLGASAGVFGLLGAISLQLGRKDPKDYRRTVLVVILGLLLALIGPGNSIAHVSGFAAGVGLNLVPGRRHTLLIWPMGAGLTLGLLGFSMSMINT